jgi:hypothetical protein
MRGISKTMLRTCAGLAVAAGLVVGGAGVADAATAAPATPSNHYPGPFCNPWAREQWNLNGANQVLAVYQGSTYTYSVTFKQYGSCLTGTLTDSYYKPTAATGPVFGTIDDSKVTFSFRYPQGSVQGTRTYTGTISPNGGVSGTWSETGSEHGSGTFTLATNASVVCNPWAREQWNLNGQNKIENYQFSTPLTYTVTFKQSGSCLSGTMTDPYYPTTGPVSGTVNGNHVTFFFTYPSGSIQGVRTFTGTISRRGAVSGTWTETGSENASSTWSLVKHAKRACPWWYYNRGCLVFP